MSSNNQLIIIKEKGKFEVHLDPCVDNHWWSSEETFLKRFNSILHAIRFANEYSQEEMIEYYPFVHPSCYEKSVFMNKQGSKNE